MVDLKNERVLVTGGAGFLGSHVVDLLKERGVSNILIPRSADYDLRYFDQAEACVNDLNPTVIFHLAALTGGIGANRAKPGKFLYDNATMGLHIMEAGRRADVKKMVVTGTICAYPKFTPVPFREEDLWSGYPEETNAPYGLAKKLLLVQAQAYREQYGLNAIYLLPVNLYGPRDNFHPENSHVIPALIRKAVEARNRNADSFTCWGSGRATREFLYAGDCAKALVLAAEKYDGAAPVNIGSGMEISIRELAETISRLVGFEGEILWDASKPDGQPRRCLDVSRAKETFGFEAETSFEEGLKQVIEWYESESTA